MMDDGGSLGGACGWVWEVENINQVCVRMLELGGVGDESGDASGGEFKRHVPFFIRKRKAKGLFMILAELLKQR